MSSYLDETDVLALLTEALSADVEAVFSDQTCVVGADSAVSEMDVSYCLVLGFGSWVLRCGCGNLVLWVLIERSHFSFLLFGVGCAGRVVACLLEGR